MQELLGGKFGEMSTLMNYTYQSFNMRGKSKVRPYYDLIANIAAEEMGHIELVANTINLLLDQTEASTDGVTPPLNFSGMTGNPDHFLNFGLGAIPGGAGGKAWTGDYVFNSGNLKLDLLHNFFLESGARMGKIRVYESTQNPVAREMIGYLIVRGGVHQEAYAKALSDLSGVDVTKLLPVPEIESAKFPHARKYHGQGLPPHPLPLQPGRLPADRGDLERPAGRHRRAARGRGRPARGRRGPRPQPGPAAVRPRRGRRGDRGDSEEALTPVAPKPRAYEGAGNCCRPPRARRPARFALAATRVD